MNTVDIKLINAKVDIKLLNTKVVVYLIPVKTIEYGLMGQQPYEGVEVDADN